MKQLLFVINPVAGVKKSAKKMIEMVSIFNRADYDVHVYVTSGKGDASRIVRETGAQYDLVVCCGGDGTLNETITGMLEAGVQVPIGYIPAGSTNDFANTLGLSGDLLEAAKQIVSGTPKYYDVGKFGEHYFSYVASFGAFTQTSYNTPQYVKNALGHLAYLVEGVQEIPNIKDFHLKLEIEGEVIEDDYLFGAICNSTSVGGVLSLDAQMVDLTDGKFEILLLRAPRNIAEWHEFLLALRNQTYDCGMLTFRRVSQVKIYADEKMPWSLDGERADGVKEIFVENLQQRFMLVH